LEPLHNNDACNSQTINKLTECCQQLACFAQAAAVTDQYLLSVAQHLLYIDSPHPSINQSWNKSANQWYDWSTNRPFKAHLCSITCCM